MDYLALLTNLLVLRYYNYVFQKSKFIGIVYCSPIPKKKKAMLIIGIIYQIPIIFLCGGTEANVVFEEVAYNFMDLLSLKTKK